MLVNKQNMMYVCGKNMRQYRKLKIIFFAIFFIAILWTCKQDDCALIDPEGYVLYNAQPLAFIDDGKVHLKWVPAMKWGPNCPTCPEVVDADMIDIFFSGNESSNFKKVIELKNGEDYSYTVTGLQNSKSYFFYIVSKKNGFKPKNSDTIMVVPNIKKGFEILQKGDESYVTNISSISVARQKNKIAYVDKYYSLDEEGNCCSIVSILISNMDGSGKELVKTNSYSPNWSPANDKIAFHFDDTFVDNVGWISQIAMYDYVTKSITQLTNDNSIKYSPVFSKNGELLLFQSNKNIPHTPGMGATNIWLLNLKTLESSQITDISKTSLRTVERPCWIDNDRLLFHGEYSEGKNLYRIFESSVSKKQITNIFESKWNDYNPSLSPDQKKIAFISNRSGFNQVWIYHIDSKTFSQITGYSLNESFTYEWDKIEWLDNSTVVFTINENQLVKQRVE